jgi:hypothetical protein
MTGAIHGVGLEAVVINSVGGGKETQVHVLACPRADIPSAAGQDTWPEIIADLRGHGRAKGQDGFSRRFLRFSRLVDAGQC